MSSIAQDRMTTYEKYKQKMSERIMEGQMKHSMNGEIPVFDEYNFSKEGNLTKCNCGGRSDCLHKIENSPKLLYSDEFDEIDIDFMKRLRLKKKKIDLEYMKEMEEMDDMDDVFASDDEIDIHEPNSDNEFDISLSDHDVILDKELKYLEIGNGMNKYSFYHDSDSELEVDYEDNYFRQNAYKPRYDIECNKPITKEQLEESIKILNNKTEYYDSYDEDDD
jgi:hypothetical protein